MESSEDWGKQLLVSHICDTNLPNISWLPYIFESTLLQTLEVLGAQIHCRFVLKKTVRRWLSVKTSGVRGFARCLSC